MFADRFEQGIRKGQLPADTDVAALAGVFNTMLEGLSIQACYGLSLTELEHIASHAVRMRQGGKARLQNTR